MSRDKLGTEMGAGGGSQNSDAAPEPYRYIVFERGGASGVVVDRRTGHEITPLIRLSEARDIVFRLNNDASAKPRGQLKEALRLRRLGYSDGAIAHKLGVELPRARQILRGKA